MTVYLVGAGPGDPGLLTVRGAELLRRADVVIYDRLSVASLLDLAPAAAERISVGKTPRGPSTPQEEINRLLVENGRHHETVVRLKGGDPFVFARGGEEALALAAAGVSFEVVPGITSAIAAPAYAGVPVTHRGLSTSFTVVTGHEDPWAATETDWDAVARVGGTIVVLMGVATRGEIAERLMRAGRAAATPVTAVSWGTRPEQRTVRTTLGELGVAPVGPTSTIVIGPVAALDLRWFEDRPLFGRRVVVPRSQEQAGALATRLRELGAEAVEVPLIAVEPGEPVTAGALDAVDWVIVTSPTAVAALFSSLRDGRDLGRVRVAALGPGTAGALRERGIVADLVPGRSNAEGLLDEFEDGPGRVLLPQSAIARPTLGDGLRAKGWTVDVVATYRTVAAPIDERGRQAMTSADAVALTSSSTAQNLADALGDDRSGLGALIAIGPATAETARAAGLAVTAIAERHDLDGLLDAVVATLRNRSGSS
ncbi:MAG TPA: uroporphyrinogen-III C-methyltransferase [Acidimicrobiales bacterium]|jgi:uroporphyrinogen III methyltransferase / synthase|nr:uroporphyrinogen-III C-methyltransferase [Acidimicrobiales bacterium]